MYKTPGCLHSPKRNFCNNLTDINLLTKLLKVQYSLIVLKVPLNPSQSSVFTTVLFVDNCNAHMFFV